MNWAIRSAVLVEGYELIGLLFRLKNMNWATRTTVLAEGYMYQCMNRVTRTAVPAEGYELNHKDCCSG